MKPELEFQTLHIIEDFPSTFTPVVMTRHDKLIRSMYQNDLFSFVRFALSVLYPGMIVLTSAYDTVNIIMNRTRQH